MIDISQYGFCILGMIKSEVFTKILDLTLKRTHKGVIVLIEVVLASLSLLTGWKEGSNSSWFWLALAIVNFIIGFKKCADTVGGR
jgi:hypothetical protein